MTFLDKETAVICFDTASEMLRIKLISVRNKKPTYKLKNKPKWKSKPALQNQPTKKPEPCQQLFQVWL